MSQSNQRSNSPETKIAPSRSHLHVKRNIFTGVLTIVPIWVTWVVFRFVFKILSDWGDPWLRAISTTVTAYVPSAQVWLNYALSSFLKPAFAAAVTLLGLYFLGALTSMVIGKRVLGLFDSIVNRIPIVHTVYGATKKVLVALQQDTGKIERVVLIEFPSEHMKTIGFVTKVLQDETTGKDLAAVYVPTTPNPTSGYLEIVPVERLIPTNLTLDEAMTLIISGGAVSPDRLRFFR